MQRVSQCTVNGEVSSSQDFRAAPRDSQQVSYQHPKFNTQSMGSWGCAMGPGAVSQTQWCLGLCTPAIESG